MMMMMMIMMPILHTEPEVELSQNSVTENPATAIETTTISTQLFQLIQTFNNSWRLFGHPLDGFYY